MARDRKPKTRLIDSQEITSYLPRHKSTGEFEDCEFRVVYPGSGQLFQEVRTNELIKLANQHIVAGVLDKRNFFVRAVLIVSVHAAWRVIEGLRRPIMPRLFISRPKQPRGAKRWIARHDRANGGIMGRAQQIQTKVQSDEEYLGRMNQVLDIRARAA